MDAVRSIVIVGGGTAGWLTAAVLAARHGPAGIGVTVVESPDVATIGVGEGTWPTMRDTLHSIGVSETDFLRQCDASFKQGSLFRGWVDGQPGDQYLHPFVLPHGHTETNLVDGWLASGGDVAFADLVSFQPHLCARGKAPKQASTPEFAAVANYAYHLDAGRFATFLRQHCTDKLGVSHVADHVLAIHAADNGDIDALQLKSGGALHGDLFIDCTGMQSLLLGQHYGVALIEQKHVLFNDRALAVQVPYRDPGQEIASQTISTARQSGWIWDIGLPSRRGIGHVYSSAHCDDAAAEQALLRYLHEHGAPDDLPTPRKLSFQPGYRQRFWHRNCVAIGLSAGFIEPLEASAIALVELSAAMLADRLPADRAEMDLLARRFNDCFEYRWQRVIEFLKLHYLLSRRQDSDFWRENRRPEGIPPRLQEQLLLWRHHPPSRHDFNQVEEVFPSASYQYILYGMGFMPQTKVDASSAAVRKAQDYFREAAALAARMIPALPGNRALLEHVQQQRLPRI
ncbi:tryptophan halogenase family protein [Pseudoxanthomonas dokdonensis]|uniref:Tryptophan halogenase n=1 Tax=Pseudoxanthomonas dokdonensis TaxID=344882 RepID=A0A0R0CN86_9GAMM|nr:tryptophan halogenase family protein [Pseudoxanthomonas dokdonensis]KRG71481.1 tryptophan halogenase [Pseudoxanthomonas dokdonensis]